MKKFTALHLADVRLRRGDEQAQAPVLHALFGDVAALRDAGKQIDAIFFTGELVALDACAGTTPMYVYEYFLRPLLQAASLPGARFYLVPGVRAKGVKPMAAGQGGFSFFSTGEEAGAQQRALYKNIHAVFHGNGHTGDSSSLMKALGMLFRSSPGSLYGGPALRAAYALLEYDAEVPATQWTVALREFEEARRTFALSVLYTPNGQDTAARDAEYVFATLLPQLAAESGYLEGLLGRRAPSRMGMPDASLAAPVAAREFLIELAFELFEAKTLFLQHSELDRFASDYCAVKGWDVSAQQWLAPLYTKGLLLQLEGQVVFAFDYFRTYFLAQRFETSFGLMPYGPERREGAAPALRLGGASAARPFLNGLGVASEPLLVHAEPQADCSRPA